MVVILILLERNYFSCPNNFGTVPVYQAYAHGVEKFKNPLNITSDDFLNAFEKNVRDGVDYTTIHSGITKELAHRIMEVQRHGGIVSKGGTITAAWMLKYDKENPYYEYFDYMCEIARRYDVTFSLGDACDLVRSSTRMMNYKFLK